MRMIALALVAAALACAGCATETAPSHGGAAQSTSPKSPGQLKQQKTPG
jgi:hypothetical protein